MINNNDQIRRLVSKAQYEANEFGRTQYLIKKTSGQLMTTPNKSIALDGDVLEVIRPIN